MCNFAFDDSISDSKNAPRYRRPIVPNIDKMNQIVEFDHYVSTVLIAQKLKNLFGTVPIRLHTKRSAMYGCHTS